jgi:hypothetical protein
MKAIVCRYTCPPPPPDPIDEWGPEEGEEDEECHLKEPIKWSDPLTWID